MTLKEDILEQVVEDYLISRGYFVMHNLKFQPNSEDDGYIKSADSVPSDIDVIGYHPLLNGSERVYVVSCKSWQNGFRPDYVVASVENQRKVSGREAWKGFREIFKDKWGRALVRRVKELTGTEQFTYAIAATHLSGSQEKCTRTVIT